MKRELKKALKPQKSFKVWAEENNVELNEHLPITKRQRFSGWIRQKKVIAGLSSALAVCLIFAILLPVLLLRPQSDNPPGHKIYTSQDSVSEYIEIEELYQVENILLFNRNQLMEFSNINIDIAGDDENLVLSYSVKDCLFAAGDGINAFYINYRIRLYEYYEFFSYLRYSNLLDNFSIGDTKINYEIIEEGRKDKKAYVKFSYNNCDYFLEVKGFEGATEITEDTLKILLNDLLA